MGCICLKKGATLWWKRSWRCWKRQSGNHACTGRRCRRSLLRTPPSILSPPAVTPPWTRRSGQSTGKYHGIDLFVTPWLDACICSALMELEWIMMLKNNKWRTGVKRADQDQDNMIPSSYLFWLDLALSKFDWLLMCFPHDYGCVWIDWWQVG